MVSGEPSQEADLLSSLPDETLVALSLGDPAALGASVAGTPAGGSLRHRVEDAFAVLVNRHGAAIRRVVRAILGDSPDADDVVQSAFTAAFRSLGRLKDRTKFKFWVRIIAVNEANDAARQRLDYAPLDELMTLPERSGDAAPVQAVEAAWLIEALNRRLPEEYMKVLYLRYYLDYTVSEVAEILGIQPGLVKWRANRAKRLARRVLQDEGVRERDEGSETTQGNREGGE